MFRSTRDHYLGITAQLFVKYVDSFQDTVYQDSSYLYNSAKKCLHLNHSTLFTRRQLCKKVTGLALCCIPLWDFVMMVRFEPKYVGILNEMLNYKIAKKQFRVFCWFRAVNLLPYLP